MLEGQITLINEETCLSASFFVLISSKFSSRFLSLDSSLLLEHHLIHLLRSRPEAAGAVYTLGTDDVKELYSSHLHSATRTFAVRKT